MTYLRQKFGQIFVKPHQFAHDRACLLDAGWWRPNFIIALLQCVVRFALQGCAVRFALRGCAVRFALQGCVVRFVLQECGTISATAIVQRVTTDDGRGDEAGIILEHGGNDGECGVVNFVKVD